MQAEPLIELPHVATELLSFATTFLTVGAVGFRYGVARGRLAAPSNAPAAPAADGDSAVYAEALRRAATFAVVAALVRLALFGTSLPEVAARQHVDVGELLTTFQPAAQLLLFLAMIVGFALAAARRSAGWPLAAVGVLLMPFVPAFAGQWARLINPLHVLAGGLWIGTLFVLVVAALPVVLRAEGARGRRDAVVADMVNAFSPLALVAASFVALFGLTTAWRHLPRLSALWTTPYGYALLTKLALVAVVVALGAWNWRRLRPGLGAEGATPRLRRSASAELTVAGLVLVASAILVSLPSPRRPPAQPAPAAVSGQP